MPFLPLYYSSGRLSGGYDPFRLKAAISSLLQGECDHPPSTSQCFQLSGLALANGFENTECQRTFAQ